MTAYPENHQSKLESDRSQYVTHQDRDPTVYDVATMAGVSAATVSRTLNGSARVSPEVAARVAVAVRQLGYVRQRSAPIRAREVAARTSAAEKAMRARVGARLRGIAAMHQQHLGGVTSPVRRSHLEVKISVLRQVAEMIETSADTDCHPERESA